MQKKDLLVQELSCDETEIALRINHGTSVELIQRISSILAIYGARLCLFTIENRQIGLAVINIQTGTVIPLNIANRQNVEYLILNSPSENTNKKNYPNTLTLTPHILDTLLSDLESYTREREYVERDCTIQLEKLVQVLEAHSPNTKDTLRIESYQDGQLNPTLPIVILPEPQTVIHWDTGKKTDSNLFPDQTQLTSNVQGFLVVPKTYKNGYRIFLQESVTAQCIEQGKISDTSTITCVDEHLLTHWNYLEQNQLPIFSNNHESVPTVGDEAESDIEQVVEEAQKYLETFFAGTPYRLARLVPAEMTDADLPDFLFEFKDKRSLHAAYPLLSMYGWQVKNGITLPIPYGNIGGIKIVSNDRSSEGVKARKDIARASGNAIRRYAPFPRHAFILTLDADLLRLWQERGTPLASTQDMEQAFAQTTTKKQADYGIELWRQQAEAPTVTVKWWEPDTGSHIGSPQMRIIVTYDKTYSESFLIDPGWIFNRWKSKGYLDFPSAQEGIGDFLKKRLFPPVTRLYRTDLLKFSINDTVIASVLNHADSAQPVYSIDDFILLEMYHRLGAEGLHELLSSSEQTAKTYAKMQRNGKQRKLFDYLERSAQVVYASKTIHWGVGLTHAHQDHTIGRSLIREAIPSILTPTTHAFLQTDFLTSQRWSIAETAYYREYDKPKIGNAWQVGEYPYIYMEDGDRMEIAPNFFITTYEGHHSIPGEVGFVVEIKHDGKPVYSVAYGGDDKDGHFQRRLQDHVKEFGPINMGFIEGTNDDRTTKTGAFTTRKDVEHSFEELFAQHQDNKVIIVDMIKNSTERLFDVVQIALARGRTIALSPKIMYRLQQLGLGHQEKLDNNDLCSSETDREFIMILRELLHLIYSGKITCWKRRAQTYKKYEKEMFASFGEITTDDLSAANTSATQDQDPTYLVIREYGESERKLDGIAGDAILWVDSMYAAYDAQARLEHQIREQYAREHHLDHPHINGLHTSGHGVLVPYGHPHAAHGIADEAAKVGYEDIIPVHTLSRDRVAQVLKSYPSMEHTKVHSKIFGHPQPTIEATTRKRT